MWSRKITFVLWPRWLWPLLLVTNILLLFSVSVVNSQFNQHFQQQQQTSSKNKIDSNLITCEKKETCQWDNANKWKWIIPQYNGLQIDGPVEKTSPGGFVLMANFSESKKFELTSPKLSSKLVGSMKRFCFRFRYSILIDKAENSALKMQLVGSLFDDSEDMWSVPSTEADLWYPAQVDIFPLTSFKLKFVATAVEGFVALSNFELYSGTCDQSSDTVGSLCNFESGICGWTKNSNAANPYSFNLTKAIYTAGPIKTDHTSHSAYGHVLNLPSYQTPNTVARLVSANLGRIGSQCFSFWFMRVGLGIDLKLYASMLNSKSGIDPMIWESRHTNQEAEWIRVQNTIDFGQVNYLYLETKNSDSKSSLKIDDIGLNPFDCPDPISCEIRWDLCGWQHDLKQDIYLWSLGIGRVANAAKLKFQSLQLEDTVLAYTDFTLMDENDGETARMGLLSEFTDPNKDNSDSCFNMFCSVKTIGNGDTFQVETVDMKGKRQTIWKYDANSMKDEWTWIMIKVPVPASKLSYRFAITVTANHPSTYVALRQIVFSQTKDICHKMDPDHSTKPSTTTTTENPLKSLDCNFENENFCNWEMSFGTFSVESPRHLMETGKSGIFHPIVDHTTDSSDGNFLYSGALREAEQNSVLQAKNPFKGQEICFQFYYFFYTARKSTFKLTKNSFNNSPLFRALGSSEFRWRQARVTISAKENDADNWFFYANVEFGMLAIDDIVVKPGPCGYGGSDYILCDFEQNSTCVFEPIYHGTSDGWNIVEGNQFEPSLIDHTTHSTEGHFYGMDLAKVNPSSKQARYEIESKTFIQNRFDCLEFSYYLANNTDQSVQLFAEYSYMINFNIPFAVGKWTVTANTESMWFKHRMNINLNGRPFNVGFGIKRTGLGSSGGKHSKIFVDDIKLDRESCDSQDCDFDNGGTCSLVTVPITEYHLTKDRVRDMISKRNYTRMTASYLTGFVDEAWLVYTPLQSNQNDYIDRDATLRNLLGKYLLLAGSQPYDRAIFVTDRYQLGEKLDHICFSFALYKPSSQSVLEIYMGESDLDSMATKIWDTRMVTSDWTVIDILAEPTQNSSTDLYLFIVGTIIDPSTYIAMDNVRTKQLCPNPWNEPSTTSLSPTGPTIVTTPSPEERFICSKSSIGLTIPISKTCDWQRDCPEGEDEIGCGNCNFKEHNLCRYLILHYDQSKGFGFNFSDMSKIGPDTGAWENAIFMVAGGAVKSLGMAGFQSPIVHQSYSECTVEFFYQYNTSSSVNNTDTSDAMFVYLHLLDIDQHTVVWQSSFQRLTRGEWHMIRIHLGRLAHTFRIIFMAYSHFGLENYHAIDQIRFETCGPLEPSNQCNEAQFHCKNKACVDKSVVCDLQDDCGDWSDEYGCQLDHQTSFEEGYNGWGEYGLRRNWKITEANTQNDLRKGPTFDHTTKYSEGSYLLASIQPNTNTTIVAEIESPPFVANDENCQFGFYFMKSSSDSILLVELENLLNGNKQVMFKLQYGQSGYNYRHLGYRFVNRNAKVKFTAILNSINDKYLNNYIALDDISFSDGCTIKTDQRPTTTNGSTTTPGPDCVTRKCPNQKGVIICLKLEQFCDFKPDCKDGSDELRCGNCDFDNQTEAMCGWQSMADELPARLILPARNAPDKFPSVDANRSASGGFLSFQTFNDGPNNQFSILKGPQINGATDESCMLEFEVLTGSKGANLELSIVRTGYISYKVSSLAKSLNNWKTFRMVLGKEMAHFYIRIKIKSEEITDDDWQLVAFDNFRMVGCNPYRNDSSNVTTVEQLNCDFEQDLCGWRVHQETGQDPNSWFRTNNRKIEPGFDHTSLQYPRPKKFGSWISTQANLHSDTEMNILESGKPLAPTNQTYCLTFWYFFFGAERSMFSVEVYKSEQKNGLHITYWTRSIPLNQNWNQAYVEIPAQPDNFVLQLVAKVGPLVVVGIDDIQMTRTVCPVSSAVFCDFEVNTCNWKIDSDQSWSRSKGDQIYKDHTTGTTSGNYLSDTRLHSTAQMSKSLSTLPFFSDSIFPTLPKSICLSLYYFIKTDTNNNNDNMMSFDDSTQLIVTVMVENKVASQQVINITEVYNLNQLATWSLLTLDFDVAEYDAQTGSVLIEGRKMSHLTHLLIDDVGFQPNRCQVNGNCDFEYDNCGWANRQHAGANILWLRVEPNRRDFDGKAMDYDHTTTSVKGNYIMYPASTQRNSIAVFNSPIIRNHNWQKACLSFYYFAQASNVSVTALKVEFNDLTHSNLIYTASIIKAKTELHWYKYEQTLENLPTTFALSLFTEYNNQLESDIGIDDISIKEGDCQSKPTTTTPSPTTVLDTQLDCDFDRKPCNWKWDTNSWNVTNFQKQLQLQKEYYAPEFDHTSETAYGNYLMFVGDIKMGAQYKIQTTVNLTYNQKHCLTMWYYEDGENPFALVVNQIIGQHSFQSKYMEATVEQKRWKPLIADLVYYEREANEQQVKSTEIEINYKPSSSARFSIFAIDDIRIRPGKCVHQHDYIYTFTNGYEDLYFEHLKPVLHFIGMCYVCFGGAITGVPQIDHTTNSDNGVYFLFKNNYKDFPTTYIDMLSMDNLPDDPISVCVRFAYQYRGDVKLAVYAKPVNAHSIDVGDRPLWKPKLPKSSWTVAEFNKQIPYRHRLVFYMEKQFDNDSFIALDDLSVLDYQCQAPINCDFEDNRFCSYSSYSDKTTNKYNFGIFNTPGLDPLWPGPKTDHTREGSIGSYLYLTAYRSVGTFTKLISKIISGPRDINPSSEYCLSMWTQLTSTDVQMKVHLVRFGSIWSDNNRTVMVGNQATIHQNWSQLAIGLNQNVLLEGTVEIQIIIEGVIEANSIGLIAIDDILLEKGTCQTEKFICEDGTKLSYDKVCNFIKDCSNGLDEINCGDCNFESGSCGWENVRDHRLYRRWEVEDSSKISLQIHDAPNIDGDGIKGHYLMMLAGEEFRSNLGSTATNFHTPSLFLKNAYKTCVLQFDFDVKCRAFSLEIRVGENLNDLNVFYSVIPERSLGDGWRRAQVWIGQRYTRFIVDFMAEIKTKSGLIALDNLKFVNCSVPAPLKPGEQCSNGEVMCDKTRICISQDSICDWVDDCSDGWDESNCLQSVNIVPYSRNCNFENGLKICDITTELDENKKMLRSGFIWKVITGNNQLFNRGDIFAPKIDNTRRTRFGSYMSLEPRIMPLNPYHNSVNYVPIIIPVSYNSSFYSPMFTSISVDRPCKIRFFYYTDGLPINIRSVKLQIFARMARKPLHEPNPLLTIHGNLEQRWIKSIADFGSIQPFQFVFFGIIKDFGSRIAIDDISYDNSSCVISSASRDGSTTTTSSTSRTASPGTPTTEKPDHYRNHPNHTGIIVSAVLVPILLLFGIIVGFALYRRYQRNCRADDRITITMSSIQQNYR